MWLEQLVQDIRFGLRTLRRNPGFTGTVVLTLALAIGMNTRVFWSLAGAQASLGRLFREDEPHAIVLSHSFFERRFHGDQNVLGQTVSLNGFPYTIIGVLPSSFQFLFPKQYSNGDESRDIDAFVAFPPSVIRMPNAGSSAWESVVKEVGPTPYYVSVIGRLRAGVSLEAARAEMNTLYTRVLQQQSAAEQPYSWHRAWRMKMLQNKVAGGARRALLVLLVAGGFVLFIACANISNLLLARLPAGSAR